MVWRSSPSSAWTSAPGHAALAPLPAEGLQLCFSDTPGPRGSPGLARKAESHSSLGRTCHLSSSSEIRHFTAHCPSVNLSHCPQELTFVVLTAKGSLTAPDWRSEAAAAYRAKALQQGLLNLEKSGVKVLCGSQVVKQWC